MHKMPSQPEENELLNSLALCNDIDAYAQSHFVDTHFIHFLFEKKLYSSSLISCLNEIIA